MLASQRVGAAAVWSSRSMTIHCIDAQMLQRLGDPFEGTGNDGCTAALLKMILAVLLAWVSELPCLSDARMLPRLLLA